MDATLLFTGTAHTISLWDSTNKDLKLGYFGNEVFIKQSPIVHNMVAGTKKQYSSKTTFEAEILEVDPAKIADLKSRQDTLQDLFVVTNKYVFKFNDVFINYAEDRSFGDGEWHRIILTAQTEIQDDYETIINLLSSVSDGFDYGNFESGSPPSNWTEYGGPPVWTRQNTFLGSGGGTYCGQLQLTSIGDGVYSDWIVLPLEFKSLTITVSCYADASAGTESMDLGFTQADNLSNTGTSSSSVISVDTSGSRYSHSATITPDSDMAQIRAFIQSNDSSGTVQIDNFQLQIGALSDYSQND